MIILLISFDCESELYFNIELKREVDWLVELDKEVGIWEAKKGEFFPPGLGFSLKDERVWEMTDLEREVTDWAGRSREMSWIS